MGYGDYVPSGGGRPKPLTKAQIRRMQQAYKDADTISLAVKKQEQYEQQELHQKIEDQLNLL